MNFNVKLADIVLEISSKYDTLSEYCREYLIEECAKMKEQGEENAVQQILITQEDIEAEYARIMQSEKDMYTPQYMENLATLRKIADIMPIYNRFLMHGAVLSWKNDGYMFTAPSGTGKSTHVALWKKYLGDEVKIINGDKPILAVQQNEIRVYGTPWAGKERWQTNISVPLKGICFIKQGNENKIHTITPKEALPMLIHQVYFTENPEQAGKTMELLNRLFQYVPMYQLECDISEEAVQCSFEIMTGDRYCK